MNRFEYKKRYDPDLGMYVKKHVHSGEIQGGGIGAHGAGLSDILKSAIKTASKKALQTAATKTGEHVGKKAGDKIIQLLRKKNEAIPPDAITPDVMTKTKPMSQKEINERVNRIISGGKLRKIKI